MNIHVVNLEKTQKNPEGLWEINERKLNENQIVHPANMSAFQHFHLELR